jgi:hypothetical protein
MRGMKASVIVAAAAAAVALAAPAYAYHGHGGGHGGWHGHGGARFGLYLGGPLYWGAPYYYPPYYYPPAVVVPQSPPVYVQQGDQAAQAPESQGWWYFCRGSNAYYPYVKHCPGGWERVSPQPPAQ